MTPLRPLHIGPLGFGTMAVGGQIASIGDDEAAGVLRSAYDAGIRFFDTAPQYGCGLAEERLGRALANWPRDGVTIASKVGKAIAPVGSGGQRQKTMIFPGGHDGEMVFDYTSDGTLRIVESSLKRLGTDYLDIVLLHDITRHFHGEHGVHERADEALRGAIPALRRLQEEGVVRAIGTGLKDVDIAARFIEEAEIEVVLVPGRMTLLDQSAVENGLLDLCAKHDVAYIAAAPFDSGILATGPVAGATYAYKPAEQDIITRVQEIDRVCRSHGVPMQAAALQYPMRHPAVRTVLAGMRSAHEVSTNTAWTRTPIPPASWQALADVCAIPLLTDQS